MIQYDPHEWWSHFFDVRGSMLREILGRVLSSVVWAIVVVYAHETYFPGLEIPPTVHTIVATALGLLLVFRTNSAYDRFWEGRKLWGGVVNETRNLARGAVTLVQGKPQLSREIVHWTIAFAYASMHLLRGKKDLGEARGLLPPEQIERAEKSDHPALFCAAQITRHLREAVSTGALGNYELVYLDNNVQLLIDYIGGCERIHRTPLPFAYLVHLRRALVLYCLALPFALVKDFGWITVPTTLAVTYVFFGIEEIGVEIEDPFGVDENDLPLEAICGTIRRNLLALVDNAA